MDNELTVRHECRTQSATAYFVSNKDFVELGRMADVSVVVVVALGMRRQRIPSQSPRCRVRAGAHSHYDHAHYDQRVALIYGTIEMHFH